MLSLRRIGLPLTLCLASLGLMACDGGEELDAGPAMAGCEMMADGTSCGSGLICISDACEMTSCGDGYVDEAAGEQCEDGNTAAFDGCEPATCTFTCTTDGMCDDGFSCNGDETCADNTCAAGTPAADGAACMTGEISDGVCRAAICVSAGCGNGVMDAGEQCDDMNDVDGDGCDNDCSFSCEMDADCNDNDMCNGQETCDTMMHVCAPGTALTCTDTDACTMDSCDALMGCVFPLMDADGDGHAPESLGACGTDCDDTRMDVNPDEQEQCDTVDHDCDGLDVPAATPFWYLDCDGDTFATAGAPSMQVCTEPAMQPGCAGGWTLTAPLNPATTDCDDGEPDAFPGQVSWFSTPRAGGGYDYNCDGTDTRRYTVTDASSHGCVQLGSICIPPLVIGGGGGDGWVSTSVPNCGVTSSFSDCVDRCRGSCIICGRVNISLQQTCR